MPFTQTLSVRADTPEALVALMERWHRQEHGVAPGYEGARLLADADQPGRFVIEVDFASREAAEANNDRSQTQAWAQQLGDLAAGEPEYHNYDLRYRSD